MMIAKPIASYRTCSFSSVSKVRKNTSVVSLCLSIMGYLMFIAYFFAKYWQKYNMTLTLRSFNHLLRNRMKKCFFFKYQSKKCDITLISSRSLTFCLSLLWIECISHQSGK